MGKFTWSGRKKSGQQNQIMLKIVKEDLSSGRFDAASLELMDKLELFLEKPTGHNRIMLVRQLRIAGDTRKFSVENPKVPLVGKKHEKIIEKNLSSYDDQTTGKE